jgi:hypothetical protein
MAGLAMVFSVAIIGFGVVVSSSVYSKSDELVATSSSNPGALVSIVIVCFLLLITLLSGVMDMSMVSLGKDSDT